MKHRTNKILVMILVLMMSTNQMADAKESELEKEPFSDLLESNWAYDNIMHLVNDGVINGYPDGRFGPSERVTSEAFIKMVVSVLGYTELDPEDSRWSRPYIEKAKELGLMEDTKQFYGKDWTDGSISREEMADIGVRAVERLEGEITVDTEALLKGISDAKEISEELEVQVAKAYKLGLITGYPGGAFMPAATLTRAEAAVVITRIVDISQRRPADQVEKLYDIEEIFSWSIFRFTNDGFIYEDGYIKCVSYETGEVIYVLDDELNATVIDLMETLASAIDYDENMRVRLGYMTEWEGVSRIIFEIRTGEGTTHIDVEFPVNGQLGSDSRMTGVAKHYDFSMRVPHLVSYHLKPDDPLIIRKPGKKGYQESFVEYVRLCTNILFEENGDEMGAFIVERCIDMEQITAMQNGAPYVNYQKCGYDIDYRYYYGPTFNFTKNQ